MAERGWHDTSSFIGRSGSNRVALVASDACRPQVAVFARGRRTAACVRFDPSKRPGEGRRPIKAPALEALPFSALAHRHLFTTTTDTDIRRGLRNINDASVHPPGPISSAQAP